MLLLVAHVPPPRPPPLPRQLRHHHRRRRRHRPSVVEVHRNEPSQLRVITMMHRRPLRPRSRPPLPRASLVARVEPHRDSQLVPAATPTKPTATMLRWLPLRNRITSNSSMRLMSSPLLQPPLPNARLVRLEPRPRPPRSLSRKWPLLLLLLLQLKIRHRQPAAPLALHQRHRERRALHELTPSMAHLLKPLVAHAAEHRSSQHPPMMPLPQPLAPPPPRPPLLPLPLPPRRRQHPRLKQTNTNTKLSQRHPAQPSRAASSLSTDNAANNALPSRLICPRSPLRLLAPTSSVRRVFSLSLSHAHSL